MKSAKVLAALSVAALLISPSFAADVAPLPAGKPAGAQHAALVGPVMGYLLVAALVGLGIAAASGNLGHGSTAVTTATGV